MKRILINATQPDEIRVAQVNRGRLIDFDIERTGEESTKGNIYKGRVTAVKADLEAAFVEYGAERHGLLSMRKLVPTDFLDTSKGASSEQRKIEDVLKVDQELLVQVDKEPYGHKKGAALTTDFSLVGRYTVLKPKNPDGGISLQITGEALEEMKKILSSLEIPEGMGLILRTASKEKSKKEIQDDLDIVLRAWKSIESGGERAEAPRLIFQENSLVRRIVRDKLRDDIGELVIDSPDMFEELSSYVQSFMPSLESRIQLHEDDQPLFSKYRIEKDISRAFDREVALPSGGRITIDPTEALVSIDVNSARAKTGTTMAQTALHTNCEAVTEIARQLRLRDIGGLIVVDFIDMEDSEDRTAVEARMEEALSEDRANTAVTPISRFGLMELQRQRMRPPLHDTSFEACPRCSGSGRIRDIRSTALSALRDIEAAAGSRGLNSVQANTPLDVATYLMNEKRTDVLDIERRSRTRVVIVPDSHIQTPHYHVQQIGFGDARHASDTPSYSRKLDRAEMQNNQRNRHHGPEKRKLDPQTPLVRSEHQVDYPKNGRNGLSGKASEPNKKVAESKGESAQQPRFWKRLTATLFGGSSARATFQERFAARHLKSKKADPKRTVDEPSTPRRNAPVILPNGEKRADYIRRRFYEDEAPRGQIIREINQMNQEKYGDTYKRLNPSTVYQATREAKPAAKKESKRVSQTGNDSKTSQGQTQRERAQREKTDRGSRTSSKKGAGASVETTNSRKDKTERRSKDRTEKQKKGLQAKGEDQTPKRGRKGGNRQSEALANADQRRDKRNQNADGHVADGNALGPAASDHNEPSVAELFLKLGQDGDADNEKAANGDATREEEMKLGDQSESTDATCQRDSAGGNEHGSAPDSPDDTEQPKPRKARAKNDPRSTFATPMDDSTDTAAVMDRVELGSQIGATTVNGNDYMEPSSDDEQPMAALQTTDEPNLNDVGPDGTEQGFAAARARNDPRNQG